VELSPFPYQGPLEPGLVVGREDLVEDLIERVTARRVTALVGPRRYGKTSLLRKVAADLSEVAAVWVDLYEVTSIADVALRFDRALGEVTGRFADTAHRIGVELSLQLGLLQVRLQKPAAERPEPSVAFQSLLDVLVRTAVAVPTLLVIDEFSAIGRVDGAAGALRTALQHHYSDLGIVFAGSEPSMMRTLFSSRPEPFYGQADLVEIPPLPLGAVDEMVSAGFASTGRAAGRLGGLIGDFTGGHPQRSMQLADACWRLTSAAGIGSDHWADGLGSVRAAVDQSMERLYSRLPAGEQAVLRAVVHGGSVYGRDAALLDLSRGAASHARQRLIDEGDLVAGPAGLRVVDPLMADWLARRFPI
jgi:hypothetical protein